MKLRNYAILSNSNKMNFTNTKFTKTKTKKEK